MMKKKSVMLLFLLYILILMKLIVFKYPVEVLVEIVQNWSKDVLWEGAASANYTLFKTIKLYIRHWNNLGMISFGNLVGNVVLFIPLGYFLPRLFQSMKNFFLCMFTALTFILGIEMFQLISNFGIFDVDDIFLNGCGVLIGYLGYRGLRRVHKHMNKEKE